MSLTTHDHTLAARTAVRIVDASGRAVGAGFLIGPDLVATCAHVVTAAVGGDPYLDEPPDDVVRLEFPLLGDMGTAVVQRWLPIEYDGTGDIAVLRLQRPAPPGARMPPLRRIDRLWDHRFRVLGFPADFADGVWSTGRIRGAQGTRWFQLQAAVGDQAIVEGFSGAPVWHEETGAVVGMTVATDRTGRTTTAYLIPVEQIIGVDPDLLPCPYRGLEPFDEEHAQFFFGRDDDIALLVEAVAAHPLVAVAGPSGAGKSSLVRAGLLPRLRAEGSRIVLLRPVPGELVEPAFLAELAAADAPAVLVVDQFEELAAADPRAARELLERIGELVRGAAPVRAVLTLRSATLDEVLVPQLSALLSAGTVLVPPMERGQLRDAIVAPAERAPGLSFEPGLVDRILDEAAAEPGQLPLVESLLTELWNSRDGGYLTLAGYQRAGGVAGVVATHAEAVVAGFTEPGDGLRLRRLFTALAAPDRDGRFVRTPLPWADLDPELRPVVHRLAAGRLVVIERSASGTEHVQVAHQALIAHWPRLRDWLTEDRAFLAWRAQLDQQRERWEAAARDDGALLRGAGLATAVDWLPARGAEVSGANHEYVRRSRARQRREVRRWRAVTAVLAVLVVAAGVLSVVTVASRNEVAERLRLANAELLAQAALSNQLGDPVTATALALAAWRSDPQNAAARTALFRMSYGMRSVDQVFPAVLDHAVVTFTASDDGDTVSVLPGTDASGMVVLTGARGSALQRWALPDVPPDNQLFRTTADGRYVAAVRAGGEVLLWDVVNRSGPVRIGADTGQAIPDSLATSPDGTRLSWLSLTPTGGQHVIWDIAAAAAVPHELGPLTDDRFAIITPLGDPGLVLQSEPNGEGEADRFTTRSLVDGSTVATFPAEAVATSGDLVLSCAPGAPPRAVVWDARTGTELRRVDLLGERCDRQYLLDRMIALSPFLVEPRAAPRDRDSDVYRITTLADGRTFELTTPPNSVGAADGTFITRAASIVPVDGDRLEVLLAVGDSLMRLHAVADTGGALPSTPWAVGLSNDQRFEVSIAGDAYAVLEPGTRTVLGTLATSAAGTPDEQLGLVETDRLTVRSRTGDGWTYGEYALPSLSPLNRYEITGRGGSDDVAIVASADRVAMLTGGVVTVFDRHDGKRVGEPIDLATTPQRRNYFTLASAVALRPGPDGRVAVLAPGAVELWDPATGTQEASIPLDTTGVTGLFLDPTGTRTAVLGQDLAVQVLDLDRRTVEEPIVLPSFGILKGFTADGAVAVLRELGESEYQLELWDPRSRREVGTLRLSPAHDPGGRGRTTDGQQLLLYGRNGALPVMLPLTPEGWTEQLCRITDRPFTDTERALLPTGTDVAAPCP